MTDTRTPYASTGRESCWRCGLTTFTLDRYGRPQHRICADLAGLDIEAVRR